MARDYSCLIWKIGARMTASEVTEKLAQARQHLAAGKFDLVQSVAGSVCRDGPLPGSGTSEMLHLQGIAALARGDTSQAAEFMDRACRAGLPAFELLSDHGLLLFRLGRMQAATEKLHAALLQKPEDFRLRYVLARAYYTLNRHQAASLECTTILAQRPDMADARKLMGGIAYASRRYDLALSHFLPLLAAGPDSAHLRNNVGICLSALGRHAEALTHFRRALALKPDFIAAMSNMLFCLIHDESATQQDLLAAHQAFGRALAPLAAQHRPHANTRDTQRPLKLGFVSADLWNHPVAVLLLGVFAELDKERFQIHVYYNNVVEDSMSMKLRSLCHAWHGVAAMGDEQLEELVRAEEIDILLDLSGHTAGNRLPLFARKPAPVQASWIGYPATTGLDAMDYYLADRFMAPPGEDDPWVTEKIVRLPAVCRFVPESSAPPANALPAMAAGVFTFASFNRPEKLGDAVLALWARVLAAVPHSRLLLGAIYNDETLAALTRKFEALGVGSDRLVFRRQADVLAYLRLHHEVDMILDTFPYSGGTTSAHAIWMGVPSLTMSGTSMSSRQTAALMQHMGLPQFVVKNENQFVENAAYWTTHLDELNGIRTSLRERILKSPLLDAKPVARGVERALLSMWQRWCDDSAPESFEVF